MIVKYVDLIRHTHQTVPMNSAQERRLVIAKEAIDRPRKTIDDLATLYGISIHSLLKYRVGQRSPNPENLAKISDGLKRFARELLILREKIDRELRDNG